MRKTIRFVVYLAAYIAAIKCSECPKNIKYTVQTINENYNYETQDFEKEIITIDKDAFIVMLQGKVPVLCKEMLEITGTLHHFSASGNSLEEIEPGTFENQNIDSQLRLSDNSLKVIRTGTFKNIAVTDLDLKNNKITTIEQGALENLPKLIILNLRRNKILEFHPDSIKSTPKLTYFDMSHNKLVQLEEKHFSFMTKERNVGIGFANNELEKIHPTAFESLDVCTLNFTKNNLHDLPNEIYENKLHYLGIAYNKLKHLDDKFFKLNTTLLRNVQLEGNDFDDETLDKLKPFMEIIEENRKRDAQFHRFHDTRNVNIVRKP